MASVLLPSDLLVLSGRDDALFYCHPHLGAAPQLAVVVLFDGFKVHGIPPQFSSGRLFIAKNSSAAAVRSSTVGSSEWGGLSSKCSMAASTSPSVISSVMGAPWRMYAAFAASNSIAVPPLISPVVMIIFAPGILTHEYRAAQSSAVKRSPDGVKMSDCLSQI
ncbi:MAG: hypothetical protein [Caudoviricetes sp.]|nr:MAG: hypothetical protein [Caudoviricetes sp.]